MQKISGKRNPSAISKALISVSDKTGIVEFAHQLKKRGITIYSTGGTAKEMRANGIGVVDVSKLTGFPEIMEGRIKTLHPGVHGGLLAKLPDHEDVMAEHNIVSIDLFVGNLYQFEQKIAEPDCTDEAAVENIDIGGPAMTRAAAKNHDRVTTVTDPDDYGMVLNQMDQNNGEVPFGVRRALAKKAFARTAEYDKAIHDYL